MIETTKRFISLVQRRIQDLSFALLLLAYLYLGGSQGYEFYILNKEGITLSFLLSAAIFTGVSFFLVIDGYKERKEQKNLKESIYANGLGTIGSLAGAFLFCRACLALHIPIWTEIDNQVVVRIVFGSFIIGIIALVSGLRLKDPIIIGLIIGLILGVNQLGIADMIISEGKKGILPTTIFIGYFLTAIRLFLLVPTPEVRQKEGKPKPERHKLGIVIAESINIVTWSYVTYEFIKFT